MLRRLGDYRWVKCHFNSVRLIELSCFCAMFKISHNTGDMASSKELRFG